VAGGLSYLRRPIPLEAEVAAHQERADRAEEWLHKVYTEIEDRFLAQDKNAR
jgi:hypothetical protein